MGESLPTMGEGSGMETGFGSDCGIPGTGLPHVTGSIGVHRERVDSGESLIGLCFPKENSPFSTSFPVNLTFEPLSWTNT